MTEECLMADRNVPMHSAESLDMLDVDGALEKTRSRLGRRKRRRRLGAGGASAVFMVGALAIAAPELVRDDPAIRVTVGESSDAPDDEAVTAPCTSELSPWGGSGESLPTYFAGFGRQWVEVSDGATVLLGDEVDEYAAREELFSPRQPIPVGDGLVEPWAVVRLDSDEVAGNGAGQQAWFVPESVAIEIERLSDRKDHQVLVAPAAHPAAAVSIGPDDQATFLGTCVDEAYREALSVLTNAPGLPQLTEGAVVRAMARLDSSDLAEPLLIRATEWAAAEGESFENDGAGWLIATPETIQVGDRVTFVAGAAAFQRASTDLFVMASLEDCDHYLQVSDVEASPADALTTITRGEFTVVDAPGHCRRNGIPPAPAGRYSIALGCTACAAGSVELTESSG